MSDYTQTPNLHLYKPTYDADDEQWGNHLNANADTLDAVIGGGPFLPTSGGSMTGQLNWIATRSTASRAAQDRSAEAANVLDFGADKTGTADSSPAFQAALNVVAAGGKVVVPAGTYALHAAITATVTAGVTLEGAGAISTHLNCTGGDGFDITLSGGAASFSARGLTLARIASTGAAYANTGISVVASATWQGGIFSDLFFFGSSGYAFATALSLTAPGTASLRDITITMPNANNAGGGVGINIVGIPASSVYAIDNSLDNVSIQGGHIGLSVGSWVQGIAITNSRMIGNDYGIDWQTGTGVPEWLTVTNSHFNSGTAGILANGVGWLSVENTLFLRFASGATTWTAIDCEGCNNITLNNNNVYGNGSGTETGFIINNASTQPSTVSANSIAHLTGYGVALQGTTAMTTVSGNSSNGIVVGATFCYDSSGTGTNLIFGNLYNGVVDHPLSGSVTATGAITPRTLSDHFADVVYAKDFGAVFDGNSHPLSASFATLAAAQAVYPNAVALTDEIDGTAIQAALNFCAAKVTNSTTTGVTGGGTVILPAGVGLVNQPLTINTANVALQGAMPGYYVRPGGDSVGNFRTPSGATQLLWTGAARTSAQGPINVLTVAPTNLNSRRLSGCNVINIVFNCNLVTGASGVLIASCKQCVFDFAVAEPATIPYAATLVVGSQTITVASTTGIAIGTSIVSAHLPDGTYVHSVTNATTLVASAQAMTGAGNETIYIGGVGLRFDVVGGLFDVNDTQDCQVYFCGQSINGAAGQVAPVFMAGGTAITPSSPAGNEYGNTSGNFFTTEIWNQNGVGMVLNNTDHNFFRMSTFATGNTAIASLVLNGSLDPNNNGARFNTFSVLAAAGPVKCVGTNTGGFTVASIYNRFLYYEFGGAPPVIGTGASVWVAGDNSPAGLTFTGSNLPIVGNWPDNTAAGGNARGIYAVDLQINRSDPTYVASGNNSVIAGGQSNLASAQFSAVGGGAANQATGTGAVIPGGGFNLATGNYAVATGQGTSADLYALRAHTGNTVTGTRRGQQQTQVLMGVSAANTTPVRLTADGAAAGAANVMNLTYGGECIALSVQLSAMDASWNNSYVWQQPLGLLRRAGGTGAIVYTPGTSTSAGNGTTAGIAITEAADTTNGGYSLTFTPPTGNVAIWHICATVTATRVDGG